MTVQTTTTIDVQGVELELTQRGSGQPLLYLHAGGGNGPEAPFMTLLAERFRLLAPSHPGFGRSSLPGSFDSVDDLAYFYLDLMEALDLRDVILLGASFGGWIAAEIAVKCCHRLAKLILVDAIGIKVGDRETRDIADIFGIAPARVNQLTFHNPALGEQDLNALSDEELAIIARNRESLALYIWEPYAHNPKLLQRLHRISVPTLLIWGESDGIVTPAYGAAYRDAIAGAHLEIIAAAGHLPHQEQPAAFVQRVLDFAAHG